MPTYGFRRVALALGRGRTVQHAGLHARLRPHVRDRVGQAAQAVAANDADVDRGGGRRSGPLQAPTS